ncbi:MAG: GAF domain-containing sensor histidine kinase [Rhodospirillaceae bacterium]|nr:GAF domain-containing sensor histidine kinase [Rhodospirillaceae bacterium]MDD9924658.1 GAF domain-containing sensor histidine kinase [Rhodospirillaceae bacterium]
MSAPEPEDERKRLDRLNRYNILDTPPEAAFDRITRIVAETIGVPIALVSLVDRDRQWFKSHHGLEASETPRDIAFCAHAILDDGVFIVEDASIDPRFRNNPLVTTDPAIRFYAGAPLTTAEGLKLGTLCAIDTVPHQLSASHKQLLTDLATLVIDEMELRIALQDAMQSVSDAAHRETLQDEFISRVTHELRTPLTSIRGALGLLADSRIVTDPNKSEEAISIANRNTALLLDLINDLLDFQKYRLGEMSFDFGVVDADMLVQETCRTMIGSALERNITIDVDAKTDTTLVGDEARLGQLLRNLISNAIKFSPDGAHIEVSATIEGQDLALSVSDNGIGIPKAFHRRVFEQFAQAPGPNQTKGTGLGLAICKLIAEAHRGSIDFDSTEGQGTKFRIRIPRMQSVAVAS